VPKDTPESSTQPEARKRRTDAAFFILALISLLLLLALLSYSPQDPAWSRLGAAQVHNLIGRTGAWMADILYHGFGYLAYAIPLLTTLRAYLVMRGQPMPGHWSRRPVGLVLTMLSLCTLAHMSILPPEGLPAGPGGAVGDGLMMSLQPWFGFVGLALVMTVVSALGLMLFFDFSWLQLFERIGGALLASVSSVANRADHPPKPTVTAKAQPAAEQKPSEPNKDSSAEEQETEGKRRWLARFLKARPETAKPTLQEPPLRLDPVLGDLAPGDEDDLPVLSDAVPESPRELSSKPASKSTPRPTPKPVAKPADTSLGKSAAPENDDKELLITPLEKRETGPSKRAQRDLQGSLFKEPQPLPSISLLDPPREGQKSGFSADRLKEMSKLLVQKLADFGVKVEVTAVAPGPVITRFEIQPAPGVKSSKISNLARDLARSMAMVAVRVVEVIPGKSVMGIEVPNENRAIVSLSEVLSSPDYDDSPSPLTMALGHDIAGNTVVTDLAKMPHLLVAGTTGSGKSVGVNAMILSLLLKSTPDELRLILVDPKMLELSVYEGIPHLLTPVITDMKEAHNGLRWSVEEMERRYQLMAALGVRNIAGYNKKVKQAIADGQPLADPLWRIDQSFDTTPPTLEPLPYIVIVIDEFADMMMMVGKKVEELIARIAQKARAAGIHMILATQRPSVDVITGLIKANVPTRIAFQVSSKIDSRTILDQGGAEQLLGHGDMLFMPPGSSLPERVHGAFVDDDEVHRVVAEWKTRGEPDYIEEITQGSEGDGVPGLEAGDEKDDLYDQAVAFVTESGKCSISSVQRKLRIGYNRAARLVETMEASGVVSPPAHNGSREVLARAAPSD
jgi:S-DNA-T family DNA segregation ATPase FtsK/SpoIIIE